MQGVFFCAIKQVSKAEGCCYHYPCTPLFLLLAKQFLKGEIIMFEKIKQQETIELIVAKLAQIDTKLNSIDKLLKDMQKSVKNADNKPK
jgi:hypothetical protein